MKDEQPPDVLEAIRKVRFGENLTETDRAALGRKPRKGVNLPWVRDVRQDDAARAGCERKRSYASEQAAKAANRRARFRLFVYKCEFCLRYHCSNADKRDVRRA